MHLNNKVCQYTAFALLIRQDAAKHTLMVELVVSTLTYRLAARLTKRRSVWLYTRPASSAASMHAASITLPLGAAMYPTPLRLARCTLSGKGKKASLEHATLLSLAMCSFFSAAVKGSGTESNRDSHCVRSEPSPTWSVTNRSIAFALSARLVPFLKGSARTRGWCLNHQLSALSPAKRVQWIRDCWPAPRPITVPLRA